MFPVGAVHAQSEGIRTLPGGEAPGRGILRKGHVSCAQKERLVKVFTVKGQACPKLFQLSSISLQKCV